MKEKVKFIKEKTSELLKLLEVEAETSVEEKEEGVINISLKCETPALVIGYHGRTLQALQTVINAIAFKNFDESLRVLVDVDGWREKREEQLVSLAQSIAARVAQNGREEPIYNLTPQERRVVHMALADYPEVVTQSEGEGRERFLLIKPKG